MVPMSWSTNQYDRLFDEQVDVEEREAQSQQVPQVNKDSSDTNTYFMTRTGITLSGDEYRIVKFVSNVDNPECISIPLLVDGIKTIAVIDTGANVTCMSTRLVKALKLMIITAGQTDRPIQLAHTNMTVKRIGSTVPVTLDTSRKAIMHPCEILDMPEGYDLLIGMDTFYEFGFGISGLPGLDRGVGHMVPHPMEDEKSALAPLVTPAVEETPEYLALKRVFMRHIRPLLDENKATPKNSFCTIPESKVYLRTPPGVTAWKREYKFSHYHEQIVHDAIIEWLKNGTIFKLPKRSPFNIPLILVGKKDLKGNKTGFRPCLDPRHLNVLLEDDKFDLPLIKDIFQSLSGSKVFSTIDLTKAYHRFEIAEEDRHKTAFTWRHVQYAFKGAPFGIKTLPSIFQRAMHVLLGDLPYVRVFIDDIIVFSQDIMEHRHHVHEVLRRLTEAKLIINEDKCHFFRTELRLLGFVVGTEGIKVDPSKLNGIETWPEPVTARELQHYLGLFNYFREHIPLYAKLAAPLERLRKATDLVRAWGENEQRAFDSMKKVLSSARVLSFPDFGQPFHVATDASNQGIGAVLYQIIDGKERWISFAARSLQPGEKNYPATKKELLAIVFALIRFHQYLWGGPKFTLYTDHQALVYMQKKPQLPPMMANWLDTLLDFQFDIVHRPGIANVLPDHLSRLFAVSEDVNATTNVTAPVLSDEQRQTRECPTLRVNYLNVDPAEEPPSVLPEDKRADMLAKAHGLSHGGVTSMVKTIQEQKWTWPNLKEDCLQYNRKCVECQRYNISKRGYHPLRTIHAAMPMDHVAIDLAGPFVEAENTGNKYLLVVVDVCTRFVFLRAIPGKSGSVVAQELFNLFCLVGFPKVVQSDNGTEFKNELLNGIAARSGVEHRFISPYHPRANGLAERFVQTSKQTVAKLILADVSTWDQHVAVAQYAMNTRVAAIHGSSPFSLFFGRQLRGAGEPNIQNDIMTEEELQARVDYMTQVVFPAVSERVRERQRLQEKKFTKGVVTDPFPDGSYVMVEDPSPGGSLLPTWEGPYKVVRRNRGGAYVLEDLTKKLLASNVAPSRMKLVQRDPVEDDKDVYEVQQILNHRPIEGSNEMEYLVRWKGYSSEHDSWIPFKNFIETTMIEKYRRRRGVESDGLSGSQPVQAASKARRSRAGTLRGARVKTTQRSSRTTLKAATVPRNEATRRSPRMAARASTK
jgi:transposase InsO family protein